MNTTITTASDECIVCTRPDVPGYPSRRLASGSLIHTICYDGGDPPPAPPKPQPVTIPHAADYAPVLRGRDDDERAALSRLIAEWEAKLADVDARLEPCRWFRCDVEFIPPTRGRPKVYCSDKCRVAHRRWIKNNPGKPDPADDDVVSWWGMSSHRTPGGHYVDSGLSPDDLPGYGNAYDWEWVQANTHATSLRGEIPEAWASRGTVISADWAGGDYYPN